MRPKLTVYFFLFAAVFNNLIASSYRVEDKDSLKNIYNEVINNFVHADFNSLLINLNKLEIAAKRVRDLETFALTYNFYLELKLDYGLSGIKDNVISYLDSIYSNSELEHSNLLWGNYYLNKGLIAYYAEDHENVVNYFNKVLSTLVDTSWEALRLIAKTNMMFGQFWGRMNNLDLAMDYLFKAENLFNKLNPRVPIHEANVYQILGNNFFYIKDFESALTFYYKSLAQRQKLFYSGEKEEAIILNNIGLAYLNIGEFENSERYLNRSFEIRKSIYNYLSKPIAVSYRAFGLLYEEQKQYAKAIGYHTTAYEIRKIVLPINDPQVLNNIYDIINCYFKMGKLDSAKHFIKIGEELISKASGVNPMTYFEFMQLQFNIELAEKNFYTADEVISELENYWSLNEGKLFDEIYSRDYLKITISSLKTNFFVEYYKYTNTSSLLDSIVYHAEEGIQLIDKIRLGYGSESYKLSFTQYTFSFITKAVFAVYQQYSRLKISELFEKLYYFSEKGKANVLLSSINELDAELYGGLPQFEIDEINRLRNQIASNEVAIHSLRNKKRSAEEEAKLEEIKLLMTSLSESYRKKIKSFETTYSEYYQIKYSSAKVSVNEIKNKLSNQSAMLNYIVSDSTLTILLIKNDETYAFRHVFKEDFNKLINDYIRSIKKMSDNEFSFLSKKCYKILIEPVINKLNDVKELIIIPDGILLYAPFEALLTGNKLKNRDEYLVDKFAITYNYSSSLWYALKHRTSKLKAKKDFVGFAPIFFDKNEEITLRGNNFYQSQQQNLPPLPHSEKELTDIVESFNRKEKTSDIFLYNEATKENFKRNACNYKIIHIASHGLVNQRNIKLSGIVFSPTKHDSTNVEFIEDQNLYSGEMFGISLDADLVVISSCESGLGKFIRGEGMMSLTRGFLYSGARNIVFSLWKVFDKSTSLFMREFYREILNGNSFNESLRITKLKFLNESNYKAPTFWSGFILIGG